MSFTNPEYQGLEAAAIATEIEQAAQDSTGPYPPAGQAYWALFVFALSLVVNFLDRGIVNLLVQPIKRDLHLSDIQMSLLMGFAFVAFYVVLGLPIARMVDSRSRRTIIGVGLTCWSVMTAACGVAQNFWSFFLCRVGVGVGEACTGPATYSMLADFFPPKKLARAIAFLNMGTIAGAGLALVLGAAVIQVLSGVPDLHVPVIGVVHNWQLVFFAVGAPGLIVAGLMTTVIEPKRQGRLQTGHAGTAMPLSEVVGFLIANWRIYAPMFLGLAFGVVNGIGAQSWAPTFYLRTYGWAPQKTGLILGVSTMVIMPIALLLGSRLAELYYERGFDDANLRLVRWTSLGGLPFVIASPLAPDPWLALGLSLVGMFIVSLGTAAQNAAVQAVTPNQMRGLVTALYLFMFNVLGTGLGPLVIAALTDGVFHNEAAIRYALVTSAAIFGPLATICIWLTVKPYGAGIARSKAWV